MKNLSIKFTHQFSTFKPCPFFYFVRTYFNLVSFWANQILLLHWLIRDWLSTCCIEFHLSLFHLFSIVNLELSEHFTLIILKNTYYSSFYNLAFDFFIKQFKIQSYFIFSLKKNNLDCSYYFVDMFVIIIDHLLDN